MIEVPLGMVLVRMGLLRFRLGVVLMKVSRGHSGVPHRCLFLLFFFDFQAEHRTT